MPIDVYRGLSMGQAECSEYIWFHAADTIRDEDVWAPKSEIAWHRP